MLSQQKEDEDILQGDSQSKLSYRSGKWEVVCGIGT